MIDKTDFGVVLWVVVRLATEAGVGFAVVVARAIEAEVIRRLGCGVGGGVGVRTGRWAGWNRLQVASGREFGCQVVGGRVAATIVRGIHLKSRRNVFAV